MYFFRPPASPGQLSEVPWGQFCSAEYKAQLSPRRSISPLGAFFFAPSFLSFLRTRCPLPKCCFLGFSFLAISRSFSCVSCFGPRSLSPLHCPHHSPALSPGVLKKKKKSMK